MKHYIEFEWDGEKASFVCDRRNRRYLRKLEEEGSIRILADKPVYSRLYSKVYRFFTRPLHLKYSCMVIS